MRCSCPTARPASTAASYTTPCASFPTKTSARFQERVTHSFSTEGITFTVYGDDEADERIIPIDCVPRLLSAAEWQHLESGLTQRIGALNRFLEDVYGEARIIADGVDPSRRGARLSPVPH